MILDFLKKKPYLFLLFSSAVFFFKFFLIDTNNAALNVNVQDTYCVIEHKFVDKVVAIIFFLFFSLYWISDKMSLVTYKIVNSIHIYCSIVCLIGITHTSIFIFPLFTDQHNSLVDVIIMVLAILFIGVQVLFVINILAGLFKKIKYLAT
ncbi:hypothetical protein [Flavobacterium sp.]|uniref:hypothetical protein n=1 Tax=Flavobacterium sp. TaxID=239 RepID=UPI003D6A8D17